MCGKDLEKLTKALSKELENISDYYKANKLKLNAKKTNMIIFRKRSLPANNEQMNVYLDNEKLIPTDKTLFLGTTIDCTLNWDAHCINVANKISKGNGMINRVPPNSLKLLYYSFVQPYIHYALPAWGGCSSQSNKRIINIQKRAIRTITKSYITAHTEPRMKMLGILKFDDLNMLQSCLQIVSTKVLPKLYRIVFL